MAQAHRVKREASLLLEASLIIHKQVPSKLNQKDVLASQSVGIASKGGM
jgi:hypothetical protein